SDRPGDRSREIVDHHGHPADGVAAAVAEAEDRHLHGLPDPLDRVRLLGRRQPGLQAGLDQGRPRGREQVREARLRLIDAARLVEHHLTDEAWVVDPRYAAEARLDREPLELLNLLLVGELPGCRGGGLGLLATEM